MKLSDFKGLFKSNEIELIDIEVLGKDYYVFNFAVPEGLNWVPGEHGLFSFSGKKVRGKKFRSFSIASTREEGVITFVTRISKNPSDFKRHLLKMKAGDLLKLRGPFGWFKLPKEKKRLLFLAGGVGIAPVRAVYDQIKRAEIQYESRLIYVSDEYVFKSEFEARGEDPVFVNSRDIFYKKIENELFRVEKADLYYVSGSPRLVKEVTRCLEKYGIEGKQVIGDPFWGY